MSRHTGLVDASFLDDVTDLLLTIAQSLDDAATRRIGERLESI